MLSCSAATKSQRVAGFGICLSSPAVHFGYGFAYRDTAIYVFHFVAGIHLYVTLRLHFGYGFGCLAGLCLVSALPFVTDVFSCYCKSRTKVGSS